MESTQRERERERERGEPCVAFVSEFERRRNASYATRWHSMCVCVCVCVYMQERPEFRAGVRAACLSFISESKRCRARTQRESRVCVGSRAGSFSFRGKIPWRAGEIREIYRFKNGISRNIMLQKSTRPYNTVYFPLKNAGYAHTHARRHARIHLAVRTSREPAVQLSSSTAPCRTCLFMDSLPRVA